MNFDQEWNALTVSQKTSQNINILIAQAKSYADLADALQSLYYARKARACVNLAKDLSERLNRSLNEKTAIIQYN